jgi:hypothetical protein
MMKISNKNYTEGLGVFLMLCILLILLALAFHFLIFKKIDGMVIGFLMLLAGILIILSKLHHIEIDHSGLVITVKKQHLFSRKRITAPHLEFPAHLLKESRFKENHLYFFVSGNADVTKIHKFKILLYGFSESQRTELMNLLSNTNS